MTQDEIIRMAREAGFGQPYVGAMKYELKRFAALVAAHEREKLAEHEPFDMDDHPPHRLCECRKCMEYFTDKAHKEALEHITDGSPCWCNPEMTYKDPINGAEVLVHKELQMTKEEIIEACKNSLNIYSFTAEALEKLIEAVRVEATVRTKDLTDEEDLQDAMTKALKKAFQLGQTYFQQADSESYAANKRADITLEFYRKLEDDTRAVIAADREKNK